VAIYSIMAFVEISNVGQAFRERKPTALAIVTNYIVVPLFAWSLGWLFLRHHPDLWAPSSVSPLSRSQADPS
jgi:arsenite transporter